MRLKRLAFCSILVSVLFSCNDSFEDTDQEQADRIEFICTKQQQQAQSRVAINGDTGAGHFEEGDIIDLFVEPGSGWSRYELQLTNGGWKGVEKKDLGTGLSTLAACYPVLSEPVLSNSLQTLTLPADQTEQKDFMQADFLYASKTVSMSANPSSVELDFKHKLHRLDIQLNNVPEHSGEVRVQVRGVTSYKIDFFDGTLQVEKNETSKWITAHSWGDGKYSVVLVPQKLSSGNDWIKILIGDKTYAYKAPTVINGSSKLESGKLSEVKLTFAAKPEDPIDAEFAKTTHWVYGCKPIEYNPLTLITYNDPEDYPHGVWFSIPNKKASYLLWDSDLNWYDCDKINPSSDSGGNQIYPGYQDWSMCWAASASNLLHWWMKYNADYIRKYDEKYGTNPYPGYPRPSAEFYGTRQLDKNGKVTKSESEIFDFFRNYCQNMGNSAHFGVNWFISGDMGISLIDSKNPIRGYFKEVFQGKLLAEHSVRYPSKLEFNRIIKKAFKENQALGLAVSMAIGLHDMVMWGAEFDEKGYVSAVYYVDSNDYYDEEVIGGRKDFQHHMCIRKEIVYDNNEVYLGAAKKTKILALNPLSLGREIWASALGSNN